MLGIVDSLNERAEEIGMRLKQTETRMREL
jgi:hypothetical protein